MNYIFDFSYLKNGSPVVTLSALGISFNRGAVNLLSSPEEVVVGYDSANHAIGVRAAQAADTDVPRFHFASRVRNEWVRIGAKDFMKFLARDTNVNFLTKARQFIPEYDQGSQTLIVLVDEAHLK